MCKNILKLAGSNKTPDWKMKDLERVLKNLKKQKSRDPLGLAKPEVAGDDLKLAIVKMMIISKINRNILSVLNYATSQVYGSRKSLKTNLTVIEEY